MGDPENFEIINKRRARAHLLGRNLKYNPAGVWEDLDGMV